MDSTHTYNLTRALSRFCSAQRHGANIVQRLSKLTIGPATVLMSLMFANAALASNVLTINASDNPNNRIQLEGNLSATVTHTAEGLAIEIPGVEITLNCPNQQACTVSIGAAASYGGTATTAGDDASSGGNDSSSGGNDSSSGGNDSSSGGGDTSAGGNSDGYGSGQGDAANSDQGGSSGTNADGGLDDLCSSPRPTEYGQGQISWDKYCQDYDPNDPIDTGNTGNTGDSGNSGSGDTTTECKGPGYDCWSDAGGSSDTTVVSNAVTFPTGSNRRVEQEGDSRGFFGFGSAGRNANVSRVYVDIPKGVVSVIDFAMSTDDKFSAGRVDFGVTADQPDGADLHLWVSKDPDGPAVSEACSYVGYAETAFRVSLDGSQTTECQLERGGAYYLNLALCYSEAGDVECRSSQAMTAEANAILASKPNWF